MYLVSTVSKLKMILDLDLLIDDLGRIKIDRSMIGNPTDFRHTVHGTGGGNLQVCVQCSGLTGFSPEIQLINP